MVWNVKNKAHGVSRGRVGLIMYLSDGRVDWVVNYDHVVNSEAVWWRICDLFKYLYDLFLGIIDLTAERGTLNAAFFDKL
jgi:hypothetical protein